MFLVSGKNEKTRRHLDNLIDLFNRTCERLEKESLRHQVVSRTCERLEKEFLRHQVVRLLE